MDRKSQENLIKARRYFNVDLSKNVNDKYKVNRIDSEMFEKGKQDGFNEKICEIPENMKENFSYVSGFEHAKRELKTMEVMYKMGHEYFLNGRNFDDAPEIYKKNAYFIKGYKDAMNLKLEDNSAIRHNRR